jgi:hypothetical protein
VFDVDSILSGPFWPERVKVIASRMITESMIKLEAVGVETNTYYGQVITDDEFSQINIEEETNLQFTGDGEGFFLFIESHRIRNAFQFDPLYAVNVSQVVITG